MLGLYLSICAFMCMAVFIVGRIISKLFPSKAESELKKQYEITRSEYLRALNEMSEHSSKLLKIEKKRYSREDGAN